MATIEYVDAATEAMEKSIQVLYKDLAGLRAGRANPQLLDRVVVDYYGTPTPLSQLGNIAAPEPRMITISLWDTKLISDVEKAIQSSDIGINPSNDGKLIRLVLPELTEERRKELVKSVRKRGETAKVAVRNIRRDMVEQIKKDKKDGELTEDDQRIEEEAVQKLTDKKIKEIDSICADKEKEILEF